MRFGYLIEPPFNYIDANGRVTGCNVELALHVLRTLGMADFEPVETEFATLLPGLNNGRWRMTTGLFGTKERRKNAQFSRPIWAFSDGLLVQRRNPHHLSGYKSVAENADVNLAVIRDQFQHRSAHAFGIPKDRIVVFETYAAAAHSVIQGQTDAYASVGRAHSGFMTQHPEAALDIILVPPEEKPPAFGSFAFGLNDTALLRDVDDVLMAFLGSAGHRKMVSAFGFSAEDIDLVACSAATKGTATRPFQ